MPFTFLYSKDIQKYFWKTIDFVENLEMTEMAGGGESLWGSLRHYDAVRKKIDMRFTPLLLTGYELVKLVRSRFFL